MVDLLQTAHWQILSSFINVAFASWMYRSVFKAKSFTQHTIAFEVVDLCD